MTEPAAEPSTIEEAPPPLHWRWEAGAWIEEPIPVVTDGEYEARLRMLPATAWNIMASAVDGAGFKPSQSEDVRHVKEFLSRVTRHPRFAADLQDAIQKRQSG